MIAFSLILLLVLLGVFGVVLADHRLANQSDRATTNAPFRILRPFAVALVRVRRIELASQHLEVAPNLHLHDNRVGRLHHAPPAE